MKPPGHTCPAIDRAQSALRRLAWRCAHRAEVERLRGVNDDLRLMVDGLETAAHEERAAVVAWLRERHVHTMEWDGRINAVSHTYDHAAAAIERGEHRREEER